MGIFVKVDVYAACICRRRIFSNHSHIEAPTRAVHIYSENNRCDISKIYEYILIEKNLTKYRNVFQKWYFKCFKEISNILRNNLAHQTLSFKTRKACSEYCKRQSCHYLVCLEGNSKKCKNQTSEGSGKRCSQKRHVCI